MASFTRCWPTFPPRPPPCFSEIGILINALPPPPFFQFLWLKQWNLWHLWCKMHSWPVFSTCGELTSPFCSGQVLGGGVGEEAVVSSQLLPLCGPTLPQPSSCGRRFSLTGTALSEKKYLFMQHHEWLHGILRGKNPLLCDKHLFHAVGLKNVQSYVQEQGCSEKCFSPNVQFAIIAVDLTSKFVLCENDRFKVSESAS